MAETRLEEQSAATAVAGLSSSSFRTLNLLAMFQKEMVRLLVHLRHLLLASQSRLLLVRLLVRLRRLAQDRLPRSLADLLYQLVAQKEKEDLLKSQTVLHLERPQLLLKGCPEMKQ